MEDFESPSLESGSALSSSWEKTREQSEKQRESYKKAQAQIQRSQKDEKKAQGDNEQLFKILQRFIQNPYYEELIPLVTELLSKSIPSRYILSLIALFYPEATIHILTVIGKHDKIDMLLSLHREQEMVDFDESKLHPTIRNWMSFYIQSVQIYITHHDMSRIMQKKLHTILSEDATIINALSDWLHFFFTTRNLRVEKRMMMRYAQHITWEYVIALWQSLALWDQELFEPTSIDDRLLFGLTEDRT